MSDEQPTASNAQPPHELIARVTGLLSDPEARSDLFHHTYVYEHCRLLYAETPRAGCTTMKNMLLAATPRGQIAGNAATTQSASDLSLVHNRAMYPTPSLADLDAPRLARALSDDGWLRFCVVRNPYSRLYSAWEGKILITDPNLLGRFGRVGAGDVVDPEHGLDVRRSFAAFVSDLVRQPELYFSDMHFRPQSRVVRIGDLPYTDVVRMEHLDKFLPRLRAHVLRHNGVSDPGEALHLNAGLGIPWESAYDQTTADLVRELFAEDFAEFGFNDSFDMQHDKEYLSARSYEMLQRIRGRNQRIATLADQARATKSTAREQRGERKERSELRAQLIATTAKYEQLQTRHKESVDRWRRLEARPVVRVYRRLQRAVASAPQARDS